MISPGSQVHQMGPEPPPPVSSWMPFLYTLASRTGTFKTGKFLVTCPIFYPHTVLFLPIFQVPVSFLQSKNTARNTWELTTLILVDYFL